jgi:hypothetical protein
MKKSINIYILFLLIFVFFTKFIYAYLEPGTLSYVIQVIIALAAGLIISARIYWKNIKTFTKKIFFYNKKK